MYTQWLWGASAFYGWPNDIAKYISEYMMYYVDIYYGSIVQLFQWNYILLELIFRAPFTYSPSKTATAFAPTEASAIDFAGPRPAAVREIQCPTWSLV